MRIVAISAIAWLTGLAAYVAGLAMFWGETLGGGDLIAVLFWSALASAVAIALVYLPAMFALRRLTRGRAGGWAYAIACMALGIVPTLLIVRIHSGGLRALGSPEAFLFYFLFATFGLVFGHGFFLAYGRPERVRAVAGSH